VRQIDEFLESIGVVQRLGTIDGYSIEDEFTAAERDAWDAAGEAACRWFAFGEKDRPAFPRYEDWRRDDT
jgi:hypothetical protein